MLAWLLFVPAFWRIVSRTQPSSCLFAGLAAKRARLEKFWSWAEAKRERESFFIHEHLFFLAKGREVGYNQSIIVSLRQKRPGWLLTRKVGISACCCFSLWATLRSNKHGRDHIPKHLTIQTIICRRVPCRATFRWCPLWVFSSVVPFVFAHLASLYPFNLSVLAF